MINIICACTNQEILRVMLRLVDKQDGWQSSSADSPARLSELLRSDHPYDLVLLGSGFGPEERAELSEIIRQRQLDTKSVDHFGGGSGLLYSEVVRALGQDGKKL